MNNYEVDKIIDLASKKNSCVLVLGGQEPKADYIKEILKRANYIMAADSGASHVLSTHALPNLLVGDFDSLSHVDLKMCQEQNVETITMPAEKDATDGELVAEMAWTQGFKNVIILCANGDRIDHMLTNIFTMVKYAQKGQKIIFCFDNSWAIILTNDHGNTVTTQSTLEIHNQIGQTVSLLALSKNVECVTTKGFKYSLTSSLDFGTSLGMSNIVTQDHATIEVTGGDLLLIMNFEEDEISKYY